LVKKVVVKSYIGDMDR